MLNLFSVHEPKAIAGARLPRRGRLPSHLSVGPAVEIGDALRVLYIVYYSRSYYSIILHYVLLFNCVI